MVPALSAADEAVHERGLRGLDMGTRPGFLKRQGAFGGWATIENGGEEDLETWIANKHL